MIVEHRVSGYVFTRAMMLAGYRYLGTATGYALLERSDLELLHVPQRDTLTEDVILSLLRRAHVQPLDFVGLLHDLCSRDTLPDPRETLPG